MTKKAGNFNSEVYQKISINDLIIFAIALIAEKEKNCTFEKLLKECFILFPKTFCLSEYSKWPDSRKIDRPLRALRDKKLIVGNPQTFFALTKSGKKIAEEVARQFRQERLKFK